MSTKKSTDSLRPNITAGPKRKRTLLSEYLYELILATAALVVISLVVLLMRLQG